jgi:hypothetical protein
MDWEVWEISWYLSSAGQVDRNSLQASHRGHLTEAFFSHLPDPVTYSTSAKDIVARWAMPTKESLICKGIGAKVSHGGRQGFLVVLAP